MKWKETKQHPGTAGPGNMLGSCLVSFHFLWAILCLQAKGNMTDDTLTKHLFLSYSGWPRRRPLRAAGVQHGGGDPPVAAPQVPRDGAPQDGRRHGRPLPRR